MSVYSTRIYERQGGAVAVADVYTVPVGKVLIVRNVDAINTGAAVANCFLSRKTSGLTAAISLTLPATQYAMVSWRGRWVMTAGEIMRYQQLGATTTAGITVCGYLLDA